ncbi:MAG: hypothetical protein LBQ47_03625, partial [Endomicrobium sp.]|nr:hypothetical protein [Endomicrobium sp.]
ISADLYSDANKAGNIIISAEGSREFLEITDGVISYYAQRAYDPEHNLFGPLFSKGIEYSSQIKNSALLAALNAVLSHGKNIDAASLDKQIQAVPNVLQIKENKTKYLQSREALKKAALKTAVDYAFNRLGLENVLKEYIDKNGLEIDYSHYRRNYSGTDLRSYKPEEADPYYDRRNGKYVINIKIPTQEFGDVYLFIAEGKIWFDTQNGYAVYRAAHFSSAEEEIGAAYSKERAWQNVQYPESFILQPHSKAARELNALLTAVTGKIIEYGAQFDEEELNKEHEGIDLYELAAYKNDQEKFEGEHLSRPMKTQIAMGGNYVPTQNTRYLAQAVKDILQRGKESKDPAKFLKEQFKDIFENFPENEDYSYELAADGNSILLKFPAQNNGEIGIIIKDDGSALEIKDDWYSEQNGDRYAHVFNTRFLGADKNPGADYSYLYYVRELVELAGKENYKKRNQIISFDKKNNWVYEDVTPENIGEFADALGDAQILGQAFEGYAPPAITEEDALRIFERLRYLGFYAGFLRVNGKIEAFSLAHGEGTLVYSIQKANTKINGTPQAINREFMNSHSQNTDYANFEESFRVEPLTKFKLHDNHPLSYTDTDYAVVLGEQQNLRYYAGIVSQSLIKGLIDYAKNLSETDGSLSAANLTADSRAGEKRLKSESSLGESPIDPGSAVKNKTAGLSSVLSDLASFVEYRKWLVLNMIKNPTFRVDATYEYAQSAAEYVENYAQTFPSSYETKKLKDGDTVNIIVINGEVPEFHKIYEFENTGLKSEGEILWRSKETGRYILYTKAKNLDKIALTANSSLENIIGVKGKITANSLTIDPRFKDDGVSYDVLGNTVVGKEYLAKLSELTGSSLPEVISQIRKEQKAEKLAIAGNFIMNLDYARSQKELLKAVGAFNNSGSAQIAVPLKLFENKTESEIAEIVSYISQRQIRVFAFEDENTNNIYSDKELIALGFAGHAYKGAKETTVIDYLIGNINSVDEIKNFNNETDLEKQIEKSRPDSTKLVSVEDYLKLLSGDDIELKIKKIAGFFSGEKIKNLFYKKITPQYAINTAYALDYAQIPDLNLKDFIDIVSLAGKPSQRQQLKHILRIDSNAALKTAYDRIEKNAVEDGKEAALLAFLKGAAQKARVKADFPQGLNDPDIENLALRSALSDYASNSSYVAGFPDSVKTETGLETITRNELSKHLKIKAQQLALIDQEAATIYELILYYGDRKLKTEINESAYKIDPNAISKLLSAA